MNQPVWGSPDQLMQVWASLIYSRLLQMEFKGKLQIESWQVEEGARIRITDDGPPWSASIQERLFDPLLFLEGKEETKATGLPLARRIIDSMGGELLILKKEKQNGFEVTIPVSPTEIHPL